MLITKLLTQSNLSIRFNFQDDKYNETITQNMIIQYLR